MESTAPPLPAWASSLVAFLLDGAAPGDLLPWGARLDAATADDHTLRLATSRHEASVVAWLKPRTAGGSAYRTTVHFLVGHEGTSLDADGRRLLDEVHAAIVRREAALPATLLAAMSERAATPRAPVPIDWLAVRAGVKPAARHVLGGAPIDDLLASASRQGLHALAVDAKDYLADLATGGGASCDALVYVGTTAAAARAAVDAERAMMDAVAHGERVSPALNAALGRALGYPVCCIDFFAARSDRPNGLLRFEGLRGTGPSASALLNDLDPVRSLVSHFVCRYDCEASVRYARAVLDAIARDDASRADELSRALEGVVLLFRDGAALQLGGTRAAGEDRWIYRSVAVHGASAAHARWRDALERADEVRIADGVVVPSREGRPGEPLALDADRVQVRPFLGGA